MDYASLSSAHIPGWAAPNFHGPAVRTDGAAQCRYCPGDDYQGATTGWSCYDCHDTNLRDIADERLSPKVILHKNCWACHEVETGVEASESCELCHED